MPCGCCRAVLRFVGVTANITDCRSVDMGSTPIRTAKYRGIPIGRILHLEWRGCRFESCSLYKMLDDVMVDMLAFKAESTGSNPVPITGTPLSQRVILKTQVVFSLPGKASHCECEEQGSRPGDNRKSSW